MNPEHMQQLLLLLLLLLPPPLLLLLLLLLLLHRWVESKLWVNVKNEFRELEFLSHNCTMANGHFHRMSMEHIKQMEGEYFWLTFPFSLALGAVFLGPHVLYSFHHTVLPAKDKENAETRDEDQDAELGHLSAEAANDKREFQKLMKRVAELEKRAGIQS